MIVAWTSSEKLRLLILHKEGVKWLAIAEKMNEVYKERPVNFFNAKNCEAEFDRINREPCPKPIAPNEPSQSFKKSTVIDAWIEHFRGKITAEYDTAIETTLVDFRKTTELIERLMSTDNRPSMEEMRAKLDQLNEENKKRNRTAEESAQLERVISVLRSRINQLFKERREANNEADKTIPPGSLSISPTKASSIALQNAFRSPSPIKSPITSPIRPLAEVIKEADAEMGDGEETEEKEAEEIENEEADTEDEPKMEVDTPVASPLNRISSPISSPIAPHIPSPISSPIRSRIASPIASPIRSPIASPIRSAVASPIRSPIVQSSSDGRREKDKSVSPRTAAERAIGDGGLEEEMEEEDDDEIKEESMEVDEKVEELVKEKKEEEEEQKPIVTRKSTRVSSMSVDTTSSTSGKEKKRKDPSPIELTISKKEEKEKEKKEELKAKEEEKTKEKKKEESKEEEPPVRRASMRGRPPSTPIVHSAPTHSSEEEKDDEKGTSRGRRSSRVEKVEEKKEDKIEKKKEDDKKEEEKEDKKRTRGSMVGRKATEEKEKEVKEEATFVAPTVASRTRQHRGSEQTEEKEKSEEPIGSKTRSSGRHSLTGKSTPESKESPAPPEKRTRRGEKKEESEEKEIRGGKETSVANSDKSTAGVGGKKDVQTETEVSIQHHLAPSTPMSPSKTRRGTERESPVARKVSKASACSSTNGKPSMVSVEVQTDTVEFRHDDVVHYQYNDNEKCFHPVIEIEQRGRGRPRKNDKEREKEIKTETEEEKPISRRTRGGETSEDERGSRSGSFSQSEKGTPSRRREAKKENTRENLLTIRLDLDDDTGRYWLEHNGASHVDIVEGPTSAKKRSLQSEMSSGGRRSMVHMDPLTHALYKACKDLDLHRHSSVFKANVPHKDAPDYYDCVHFPMSLSKLKTEVTEGIVNDPVSLRRKLQIMFMNGAMYNSTAHDYWGYAVEMYKETFKPIKEIMPEMMVEEEEAPKQTRTRRNNEPAFAKDAVLCERDRSITHDRSFKCESVDADDQHLDTSSDDNRAIFSRTKVDYTRKRRL